MKNSFLLLLSLSILFISCSKDSVIDESWLQEHYRKHEIMIEMRDGVELYTAVYEPVCASKRPILMTRTPYSCAPYGEGWSYDLTSYMQEFLRNEYIIVFQDVRGRYMSEGEFVNVRPYVTGSRNDMTDEASDTYDTIEWLVANTTNNGSVGVTGMSYPGFYATMAALSGHPALKAVSPQAPILDWYKGDDVHHNGALMIMDIYSFSTYMFKDHDNPVTDDHGLPSPIGENAYEWFLQMLTPSALTSALPDTLDFWNEVLQHPDYDQYWNDRSLEPYLTNIKPAILVVGGTFDTDDCYGALNTYKIIKRESPDTDLHLVYGPWSHGAWHDAGYQGLGSYKTPSGISSYFMKNIELPFFQYYLEGVGKKPEPVYVRASGSDNWQVMDQWPSENLSYKPLYFASDKQLKSVAPVEASSYSSYVSDPKTPVPFMYDASKRDNSYMVADQSFASERTDVLTFIGEEVEEVLKLQGPVKADLYLSMSTDDADIVVKLIDVSPDGYQLLIRGDVFPARYRESLSDPRPVLPGQIFNLQFTMNDIAYWVQPGHRLMVQVQSSWFPLVNMNPQSYLENIYEARPEDYVKSEITLYHDKNNPSCIILPLI